MKTSVQIGAPGSVMRVLYNSSWGDNRYAVLEYVGAAAVVRAAQSTLEGARQYMKPGRWLCDVTAKRILVRGV